MPTMLQKIYIKDFIKYTIWRRIPEKVMPQIHLSEHSQLVLLVPTLQEFQFPQLLSELLLLCLVKLLPPDKKIILFVCQMHAAEPRQRNSNDVILLPTTIILQVATTHQKYKKPYQKFASFHGIVSENFNFNNMNLDTIHMSVRTGGTFASQKP